MTLTPAFASGTMTYTASVGNAGVTATASDANANFEVTPEDADEETLGDQMALVVGETTVSVEVTAEDGETTQAYTLTVTRAGSGDAAMSALPLNEVTQRRHRRRSRMPGKRSWCGCVRLWIRAGLCRLRWLRT